MNATTKRHLREAIDADPLGLGWPTMTDEEVAQSMNLAETTQSRLVPLWKVQKHAIENNYWLAIETAAASHTNPGVQMAAKIAQHYLGNPRFEHLDMSLPTTATMLELLVTGEVITTDQRDALLAMATITVPYLSTLGLDRIGPGHIAKTRAL